MALAAIVALVTFIATTPTRSSIPDFLRDFEFVAGSAPRERSATRGYGFAYHFRNLARDLGWIGLSMIPVALAMFVRPFGAPLGEDPALRGSRQQALIVLWICFVIFAVPIALAHVRAERYLAPVIPIAALLVAEAAIGLGQSVASRFPRGRISPRAAEALAILVSEPRWQRRV